MKLAALCLAFSMIVSPPAEAGALSGLFKALFKGGDDAAAHAVRPAPMARLPRPLSGDDAAAHAVRPAPQALDDAARSVGTVAPAKQADIRDSPPGAAQAGARALGRCTGSDSRDQDEEQRRCGGDKSGSKP